MTIDRNVAPGKGEVIESYQERDNSGDIVLHTGDHRTEDRPFDRYLKSGGRGKCVL